MENIYNENIIILKKEITEKIFENHFKYLINTNQDTIDNAANKKQDFLSNEYNLYMTNDIYKLYGKPIINNTVIIEYTGLLLNDYKNENDFEIYLNYGYGNLWNNKEKIKMIKIMENDSFRFFSVIQISSIEHLNICFMDLRNNYDLNNACNDVIYIEKKEYLMSKTENKETNLINIDELSYFEKFINFLSKKILNYIIKIGKKFDKI